MSNSRSQETPLHYALLLFPQFEILDAFGPIECLNILSRLSSFPWSSDLTLSIIAPTLDPVSTGPLKDDPKPFNGNVSQRIVPTHTFANPPEDIDVLILPGGFGAGPTTASGFEPDVEELLGFLARWYERVEYIITICTGSGLIARAGILDGHHATTNKVAWKSITPLGPRTHWVAKARWVITDNGKIYTSSGVSAGTDCFLAFIENIYGTNEQGESWGDVVSDGMEWNRVRESGEDAFAVKLGVEDVSGTG